MHTAGHQKCNNIWGRPVRVVSSGDLAGCLHVFLGLEPVKRTLQRHRRIYATGILFALVLAWVVPVQACLAAVQYSDPGCTSPCACGTAGHCGSSIDAACSAAMLPAAVPAPQSLDKVPPPASPDSANLWVERIAYRFPYLPDPPDPRSTPSLNIRFCTFLE